MAGLAGIESPPVERVPFVDLGIQYGALEQEIKQAVETVLSRSQFILGPQVQEFEATFAEFVQVEYAVGVSSGLDALQLTLLALGVGRGDEVVIPANTYIATALAVSAVEATPVLVDCDPRTYQMDPALLEAAITSRTRVLIPVHLTGQAGDMGAIVEVARRHGLDVVEDAAQAHGAAYDGRPCGGLGAAGCFSFYPGKNLGAYGDGGLVTTRDASLADRLRILRNYGQAEKYHHVEKGLNARLDTLQAAVLGVKLRYLEEWNAARAAHADRYRALLAGVGDLRLQQPADRSTHVYHLFVVETAQRDALQQHLGRAGIETGVHYPIPIHLQPAYRELGYSEGDFPFTEQLAATMLSLPMFPELELAQIERVAGEIRRFFDGS